MPAKVFEFDKVAYAETGPIPWHKTNCVKATLDQCRNPAEFGKLVADWEPVDLPIFYKHPITGEDVEVKQSKVRIRSDNHYELGTVGKDHTTWPNEKLFQWFAPFIDKGLLRFETGGTLQNGEIIWAQAKSDLIVPQEIVPGDPVESYLMASHGHSGNLAIRLGFTQQRTVCWNTLVAAILSEASKFIRLRHQDGLQKLVEDLRDILNLANAEFEATAEQYRLLSRKGLSLDDLRKYVKIVLKVTDEDEKVGLPTRLLNTIDNIVKLHDTGEGANIAGVHGTYWGAYNAVTNWLTHERGQSETTRLQSLWFGDSAKVNQRALDTALALAS